MSGDPWAVLRGLFPKWDPTLEEAGLFRRAFGSRRADLLQSAIEDYRTYYKYREPNLGEILKRYADLVREVSKNSRGSTDEISDQDDAADAEAMAASRRRIGHDLELLSKDSLDLALAEIGKMPSLGSFVGRLAGDIDKWTHVQRGLVWAKAEQMGLIAGSLSSTAPQSPSQDQG